MIRSTCSRYRRRWPLVTGGLAVAALAAVQLIATPGTGMAVTLSSAAATGIRPVGDLDCNGYSPVQRAVKPGGIICAEVHGGSGRGQLYDNGYYIGHDEPTVQFYSRQPGSSTDVTWVQTLPRDPSKLPTVRGPGKDVTHFFELMPALWYSMALCDPRSYPQLPCTPDSDTNSPHGRYPGGGSAFLELQLYPPGFPPFADALSCDDTHWCGALTIDSLECTAGFASCNNNCVEPVNFAFIQTNGVPTGPPSPQDADLRSFTPNRSTLLMNPGDKLQIRIFDNARAGALETQIRDLSTGRTGFMLASAGNGFMNTSIADCSGSPWSFRPLYSTAKTVNQGGWAAANINVAYEVGHFTPCTKLQGFAPVPVGNYADPSWNFCRGPYENAGPPDGSKASGETNDAPCFKAGDTHGPLNSAPDLATGCTGADLDYDGTSYWRDWPDSVTPGMFPSPLTIQQPTTVHGARYPQMQFLTDNPGTNILCNPKTLAGCVVPPPQAPGHFYPYWTQASVDGACVWEFGQMSNGNTFGQDKQYGQPTAALGLLEDAGPIMRNPNCLPTVEGGRSGRFDMTGHWLRVTVAAASAGLALPLLGLTAPAAASSAGSGGGGCSAGAHTLSPPGSRLYPDTGNGGYASLHTLVHLVYDATTNMFLPGNQVVLTDRATQCLTSFSLDFERRSANASAGPDMSVTSVTVNGRAARFSFVQPTYPGDPNGQNDPDPAAHEASQTNPVGGPQHNPLPPACSPELPNTHVPANSLDGTQCPASKLVITPREPIRDGSVFTVTVGYTGRPGVHNDGDGTTEGWFRAPDGGFVTTEPVGSEDWMPLNDYPAAKPSYDFSDTVAKGRSVIANGVLVSVQHHPASREFPGGSVTWNWHAGMPVASYLVEDSIGHYSLTSRIAGGIRFYQAQDTAISAAQQKKNLAIMDMQPDITQFESQFSGPYPFISDGIIIGTPQAGFEEEMETMIAFAAGRIDTDTLYHENMHQWWGDNVTEGGYRMTFFKEGLATLAEFLYHARLAENAAGGPSSAKGQAAFQASLVRQFNKIYRSAGSFWAAAPSNPEPFGLFSGSATYDRPGAAYIALRQILGHLNFTRALQQIQRTYGGASITEAQLEAVFHQWLPVRSSSCQARLSQFFTQWFDTAYPPGGGNRPMITGPGLAGPGFYSAPGMCA